MAHRLPLLAVHAHPDDETIMTGGVMARYAAEGLRVACITCTGGENGEIVVPELDTPENRACLGEIRAAELVRARPSRPDRAPLVGLPRLGRDGRPRERRSALPVAGRPRGGHGADLRLVRTIEPDVIVSYNDFGGYGHPDHIRAALLAKAAFELAGDPTAFPDQLSGPAALRPWTPLKLYELVTVTGHSRGHKVMRLVREQGLAALPTLVGVAARWRPRAERARSQVASAEGRTTTRVDIAPWLELKHRALAEHRSQISPTHPYLALTTRERRAVSPTEDFTVRLSRIAVHPPEDDLFAGLR